MPVKNPKGVAHMAKEKQFLERAPKPIINVRSLQPGAKNRLNGDATAEVVSNPQDGVWILIRYLSSPANPTQVGTEELAFAEEVLEVL